MDGFGADWADRSVVARAERPAFPEKNRSWGTTKPSFYFSLMVSPIHLWLTDPPKSAPNPSNPRPKRRTRRGIRDRDERSAGFDGPRGRDAIMFFGFWFVCRLLNSKFRCACAGCLEVVGMGLKSVGGIRERNLLEFSCCGGLKWSSERGTMLCWPLIAAVFVFVGMMVCAVKKVLLNG